MLFVYSCDFSYQRAVIFPVFDDVDHRDGDIVKDIHGHDIDQITGILKTFICQNHKDDDAGQRDIQKLNVFI